MKVRLSTLAVRDLHAIKAWIAPDNPARAITSTEDLRSVATRIATMPQAFPLIPRYESHGIRRRSWKGYGILYSVQTDGIFIHRIIGPGQDHDRALGLN